MRMVDEKLLEILVCPENRTPLATADEELLAKLNRVIGEGNVKNRLGQTIETELKTGLVREDRLLLYPVVDGIPVMLVDEAIPLEQIQ
jgi:uncharacterized protein YbaR (Trm112 family)